MKENSIEELKQRLEELYQTQQARLDVGADDLDIREEIAEVEDEIKESEDDINEENNNGNDTNVGSIEDSIEKDIERLKLCSTNQCNICGRYEKEECMLKRNRCEQHILSDYKRVLKENEELKAKWDKDTHILQNKLDYANADRIDLAQQNKELRKENNRLEEQVEYDKTHIYTPQTIELNFISKSKIKDKIEEIQKEYNKLDKEVDEYIGNDADKDLSKYYENKEKIGEMQTLSWCIDNLQELLQLKN